MNNTIISPAVVEATCALDQRSSQYRVQLTPEEAQAFCAERDPWVGELLAEIDQIVPVKDYGPHNPNSGKPHHHYYIGREYSRVVYVSIVRAYLPDSPTVHRLVGQLGTLAKAYSADEHGPNEEMLKREEIEYRIWWD